MKKVRSERQKNKLQQSKFVHVNENITKDYLDKTMQDKEAEKKMIGRPFNGC